MGSKPIRSRVPGVRATFSSVRVDGWMRPLSRRATTDCVVSMRSASSTWMSAALRRASMSVRASSNSGPRRSDVYAVFNRGAEAGRSPNAAKRPQARQDVRCFLRFAERTELGFDRLPHELAPASKQYTLDIGPVAGAIGKRLEHHEILR